MVNHHPMGVRVKLSSNRTTILVYNFRYSLSLLVEKRQYLLHYRSGKGFQEYQSESGIDIFELVVFEVL